MVLAEVPFWIVHSVSSQGENSLISTTATGTQDPKSSSNDARETSTLSETIKAISGTASRCAIYSVDIHPDGTRFATAGGDGKVRIWASNPVFNDINNRKQRRRGEFKKGGGYDSSGSSSAGNISDDASEIDGKMKGKSSDIVINGDAIMTNKDENDQQDKNNETPVNNAIFPTVKPSSNGKKRRIALQQVSPSPVESTNASPKPSTQQHRMLSSLSSHTGSVLCVRWSHSGTYLASSGDDAHILLYKRSTSQHHSILRTGNLLSSSKDEQVEHWIRIRILRGHNLDAVGLAWAPDDSHLVSCSLDSENPIIVWKLNLDEQYETQKSQHPQQNRQSQNILHPFKILGKEAHKSTVKGVVFDPAGKYIATSGDDPAICIWRAWDDWGLESRIDSESGIFRSMKSESVTDLSLFRRMSFAPDGTHLCSTNSVMRGKNIAAMVTRSGWLVKSAAEGGVSLVGHKQPIVSSRHCPYFFEHIGKEKSPNVTDNDDVEPDYAMLVALGDKRGFVTVWSTKSKRPIFKLQCSETRCTITDLTWGRSPARDFLWLYISMLDGHVVTLQFKVNEDVGRFLSDDKHARIFRLKYGIHVEKDGMKMRGVVCGSASKLIENALQYTLEEGEEEDAEDNEEPGQPLEKKKSSMRQTLTIKSGKKRIRPVSMNNGETSGLANTQSERRENGSTNLLNVKKKKKSSGTDSSGKNSVKNVLDSASKAAEMAESMSSKQRQRPLEGVSRDTSSTNKREMSASNANLIQSNIAGSVSSFQAMVLTPSTNSTFSVDLDSLPSTEIGFSTMNDSGVKVTADCNNHSSSCTLSISQNGKLTWKDRILNSRCTCLVGSKMNILVGTNDGVIHSYATAPSTGFQSGMAFRSRPPLVIGSPIVSMQIFGNERALVISSNGNFGIYDLLQMKLVHKNSMLPPLNQMRLSANSSTYPKLAKAQVTKSNHFIVLLSMNKAPGGNLQAFVYSENMELWNRVADGSYSLSEFYSTLPKAKGILSNLHNAICMGGDGSANSHPADLGDVDAEYIISRSHCEDRMACAVALQSKVDFEFWLKMYARRLGKEGEEYRLRFLIDLLLQKETGEGSTDDIDCWWLNSAGTILGLEKKKLIKIVIEEMGKNRALQRLTNEISMEIESI